MSRTNAIASLLDGFNAGYRTVGGVLRDRDIRKVAEAKPTTDTGFTPEQGEQLRAAADSGQYDVTWDAEGGKYKVTPKADPTQSGDIAPGQRTSFLGNIYDKAPDEARINRDRSLAMAGVLEKYGDPHAGVRMRDAIRQGDIAEEGLKIQRQRADRENELAPLQIEQARLGVEGLRRAAGREERVAATDAGLATQWNQRLANPDGTRRQATPDDHLWMTEQRIYALTDSGDMRGAQEAMQAHAAQSLGKLALDDRQRAAAVDKAVAGLAAGNYAGAMDVYNKFLPDGAAVTAIKPGKNGSLIAEREANGVKLQPHTFRSLNNLRVALESIKDSRTAWQMSMQLADQNFRERADARAARAEGRAAGAQARADGERTASRDAATALFREQNPNATPAQIEAVRRGVIPAVPERGNQPAEVKLAQAFVGAGLAPDMKTALGMAVTKNADSPSAVYLSLMRPQGGLAPREADVAPVMESVYGPGWRDAIKAPTSGAPARAAPKPIAGFTDADVAATAKKYGVSEAEVRQRLQMPPK